jgi:hypothetical protein
MSVIADPWKTSGLYYVRGGIPLFPTGFELADGTKQCNAMDFFW